MKTRVTAAFLFAVTASLAGAEEAPPVTDPAMPTDQVLHKPTSLDHQTDKLAQHRLELINRELAEKMLKKTGKQKLLTVSSTE